MTKYAANTDVSSDRSRAEIERTLSRYGAQQFMYGYDQTRAIVGFQINSRQIRFVLPLPDRNDREFTHTPARNQKRTTTQHEAAYEQAVRQKWRALSLVIKAKLEAVDSGIVTFDAEFLPHIVLPNGQTVADEVVPAMQQAYETNRMPVLLPEYGSSRALTAAGA
jgi:glycogen debranching enzyme